MRLLLQVQVIYIIYYGRVLYLVSEIPLLFIIVNNHMNTLFNTYIDQML